MVSSVHGYHRLWNRDPKVCVFNWLDLASRTGHLDARHGPVSYTHLTLPTNREV